MNKHPSPILAALILMAPVSRGALSNYWPLDGTGAQTTAANSVAGGTVGTLFTGAAWVTDATRGPVLEFNGAGGYVAAGALPELAAATNFTWAFWANSAAFANPAVTVLGNRTPDSGWTKFTPGNFEFRDLDGTFNTSIDYPDFATDVWAHHAVVKNGSLFTYYRDGVARGSAWGEGTLPAGTPLYFGGDTVNESWAGRMDEVATWTNALPSSSLKGLVAGAYKPNAAPLTYAPALTTVLAEDFSTDLSKWNITSRGLENNAPANYNPPSITGGVLTLGGQVNNSYWYGSSLESKTAFDSRLYSEVSVKRTALSGSGTAYRSSLWILGDNTHYLHFSQNVGEGGWSWNSQDGGGIDAANATGSGTNLTGLDSLDGDLGEHTMKIRIIPAGLSGSVNMELILDDVTYAVRGFTAFPSTFRVILTGQARQAADTVSASFDDVKVARETLSNLPPSFSGPNVFLPPATPGVAYTGSLAGTATDVDGDALTYAKISGSAWLSVSASGAVTGTPPATEPYGEAQVSASDGKGGLATAGVYFRIKGPAVPIPPIFGWWPMNQAGGTIAAEATGAADGAYSAAISNAAGGGLGAGGSVWMNDAQFGRVFSSTGAEPGGGSAVVGTPPDTGLLPVLDAATDFSWSFWAKPNQGANNDIILGNRYDSSGAEFSPLQFVKFTSSAFEWYVDGQQQGIDYPDLEAGVWAHHAIVKKGSALYYYRNGSLAGVRTLTVYPEQPLPLFFSGQKGVEVWGGELHDIRLFNGALSDADIATVISTRGQFPLTAPTFTASVIGLPDAAPGVAYSQNLAAYASDPQGGTLSFSLTDGAPWLSLSPQGILSGTPDGTPPLFAEATVTVKDNQNITAGAVFRIRVGNPAAPVPPLFGWWPLNEGSGNQGLDKSGAGNTAIIANVEAGGLGTAGSAWVNDPVRGQVLSFNGTDNAGTWASVGDPSAPALLPLLDLASTFTWSFRAKSDQVADTAVVLGNRYDPTGAEFVPRQFVKFTTLSFEWHSNGAGQDINYPDFESGVWVHHTVVKDADTLFYYRDGILTSARSITDAPDQQLPLYFGGQGPNGVEAWRGYLSDVRLFNGALSSASVDALAKGQLVTPPLDPGFRITGITMAPNRNVTLQWPAEAGATYTVYGAKALSPASAWLVLNNNVSGGSYTLTAGNAVLNPATETRLFFRIGKNP